MAPSGSHKSVPRQPARLPGLGAPLNLIFKSLVDRGVLGLLLALRRSIQWWIFVRGAHLGQGEREGSLAEKALLSSIFGKLTQKTLARVSNLFFGANVPGVETLDHLI